MVREPARLQLDPAPAKVVGTAVHILSGWIGVEHLRLGGGTALEARWHHRSSTDLDFFFSLGPCDEVEYETGVVLGGTRDVLTKKMYNRLGINQLAIQRDAYDFAVARTLAPDDLAYAWSTMTDDMERDALAAYRDLAEGGSHPRFRRLENASHGGIAADLWNEVLRMLETNLEYVPSLGQGDNDTGHRNGGHGR